MLYSGNFRIILELFIKKNSIYFFTNININHVTKVSPEIGNLHSFRMLKKEQYIFSYHLPLIWWYYGALCMKRQILSTLQLYIIMTFINKNVICLKAQERYI